MSFKRDEIEIVKRLELHAFDIYVLRNEWNQGQPKVWETLDLDPKLLEISTNLNTPMLPTARLDYEVAKMLVDELQKALGNGYTSKPESLLQGKLEATVIHLRDMRRLVFREDK